MEREKGKVRLQYPFFRLPGISVGDLIAVTDYRSFKLLEVTKMTVDRDEFLFAERKQETHSGMLGLLCWPFAMVKWFVTGLWRFLKEF